MTPEEKERKAERLKAAERKNKETAKTLRREARRCTQQLRDAAEIDEDLFSRDPWGNGTIACNRCRAAADGTFLMKAEAYGTGGKGLAVKIDVPRPADEGIWYARRVKGRTRVVNGERKQLHDLVWRAHLRLSRDYYAATEKKRSRMLRSRARFLNGDPLDCRLANLGPEIRSRRGGGEEGGK